MNQKQLDAITAALVEFVIRVSKGRNVSPAESAALPETVRALCELTVHSAL